MAAICLTVEGSVKDAFQAAQDDRSIRSLSLSISIADEAITLTSTIPCSSSVSADFEALSATLEEAQPQFIAFCVDDDATYGAAATARQWVLVCYVPDLSKPREKMLYSSSREALKRELGIGFFVKGDFYCNEPKDLSWEAYQTVGRYDVLRDT